MTVSNLPEYIEIMKTSSDRVRWALYAVFTVTAFVAINNYNVQSWSWPVRRLAMWYEIQEAKAPGQSPRAVPFGDFKRLEVARDEYLKQFVARYVLPSSSALGLGIDVNDTGMVGGFLLTLSMLVLVVCLAREHEVVALALRRITIMRRAEHRAASSAQDEANEFYHLLAMTQVLSSPPTSARWYDRGIWNHLDFALFVPVGVYMWVVNSNWQTYAIAQAYGVPTTALMIVQTIMLILLLLMAASAWLHVRAMSLRWRGTFFRINPHLKRFRQTSAAHWLKIRWRK